MKILEKFKAENRMLEGPRICLRLLRENDASSQYCDWLGDREVNKFLATKSSTIDELRDYIRQKNADPHTLFFGIFIQENDGLIGSVKLDAINVANRTATIAIMIGDKTWWGRGVAGEAMGIILDYGFAELGLAEINLGVIGQNLAAIRAYKKLGFVETRREKNKIKYENMMYDHVTMTIKP